MKRIIVLGLFLFAFGSATQVNAQAIKPRTVQGVKSGEITKAELKRIKKETKDVKRARRKAAADGQITRKEKAKINRQRYQANKAVYRSKHNNRDRN
ncbi:MAG: hypothetical protein KTR13_04120 [Saprospiraceae bacterium]|nr:hypothetical protein [Saprospiraceae bacterium]